MPERSQQIFACPTLAAGPPAELVAHAPSAEVVDHGPLFRFPLLDAINGVSCAFTSRLGGVSPAPYDSLNVGSTTLDNIENVRANRRRVAQMVGHPVREWVRQVHGNEVRLVTRPDESADRITEALPRADAVMTRQRGVLLTIYTADCVPIVLVDPETPAVAVVHGGWRGTVAGVVVRTVEAMGDAFGTRPAALRAGIAASIGPCCMQVDRDVSDLVVTRFPLWQDSVLHPQNIQGVAGGEDRPGGAKSTLDLWELNRLQLLETGVPRPHIAVSHLCTACRADLFFSYRRDRGDTGRLALMVVLT